MTARDTDAVRRHANTAMLRLIWGKWASQAIYAITELGVPDLLARRAHTAVEIAEATNTKADALNRVLRFLSAHGILAEGENGEFSNTALSDTLRSDVQGSLCWAAQFEGMSVIWEACGELLHCIRTGKSGFSRVTGKSMYEYFGDHCEEANKLDDLLTVANERECNAIVDAYDFSMAETIIDVGGGHGHLLAEILRRNPRAKGVLFDLRYAADHAKRLLEERGVEDRVDIVVGDAFESVRHGGDIYLLKRVIHNFDDAHAIRLMNNCRRAMRPGGKVLIAEILAQRGAKPDALTPLDLEMLVLAEGGRERTEREFRNLYMAAGLRMTMTHRTVEAIAVMEGVAPTGGAKDK